MSYKFVYHNLSVDQNSFLSVFVHRLNTLNGAGTSVTQQISSYLLDWEDQMIKARIEFLISKQVKLVGEIS